MELAPLFRLGGKFRDSIVEIKNLIKAVALLTENPEAEPTRENTKFHNSHILIDIRDGFLQRCKVNKRLYRALFNLAIIHYEYDEPYRQFGDWLIDEIRKSDWEKGTEPNIMVWKQDWELDG